MTASKQVTAQSTAQVTAVVLGGGGEDDLSRAAGVGAKALVPFEGKPLACYVLDALRASLYVHRSLYVGEGDAALEATTLPPGNSFVESFSVGVAAALEQSPDRRVLVVTADLPWLKAQALDDFLGAALGMPEATLVYPIIQKETATTQFPAQHRTFVKLREGRFTGGNMMLLSPQMVPVLLPFVERAYRGRKNPLALARLFGFDFILKLVAGRLSLEAIEARATQTLGQPVRVFVSGYASIGADVDKPEHLVAVPLTRTGG